MLPSIAATLVLLQAAPGPQPPPGQPVTGPPATAPAPAPAAPEEAAAPATADPFEQPAATQPAPQPAPAQTYYYYTPYDDPAPKKGLPESVTHRKLVVTNFFGVNFGVLWPVPSIEGSFFLGSSLPPRKSLLRGFDWNTALGYQLTLSLGGGDLSTLALSRFNEDRMFFHRHHFTATGYGGKKGRLFFSLGGGAWLWMAALRGFEGEGRIGFRFAVRQDSRASGVVGFQSRITGALEGVPTAQFGLFIGYMVF